MFWRTGRDTVSVLRSALWTESEVPDCMETYQSCQPCAGSHRGTGVSLHLNRYFLTQEHPLGLTVEMRPEVKRWQRGRTCGAQSSSPHFLPLDFPSVLILVLCLIPPMCLIYWSLLQCRSCVSETHPSVFQFCASLATSSPLPTWRVWSVLLAL